VSAAACRKRKEVLHLDPKQPRELDERLDRRASIAAEDLAEVALREAALKVETVKRGVPLVQKLEKSFPKRSLHVHRAGPLHHGMRDTTGGKEMHRDASRTSGSRRGIEALA
jgi:hypothetical protein